MKKLFLLPLLLTGLFCYENYAGQELNYTVEEVEEYILFFVNREREERGVPALKLNNTLIDLARSHSLDMVKRGFFSHKNPDGEKPADRAHRFGIEDKPLGKNKFLIGVGENIGQITWGKVINDKIKYIDNSAEGIAKAQVEIWMNSKKHRRSILNPEFDETGIGVVFDGKKFFLITQVFR